MGTYRTVESVAEAQRALADADGSAAVIAGGQEVMLDIRHGAMDPETLVDISGVAELNGIRETEDAIRIGACVTYRELERSASIRESVPFLVAAVEDIAGPQVRNNGTVGGALCDADPVYDVPPVLLALDATVSVDGTDTTRTLPLSEFYTGNRETVLADGEILTSIRLPELPPDSGGTYRSMTPRQGDSTVAGVAVRLAVADGTCRSARIALTNAAAVPTRARRVESTLEGTTLDDDHVDEAVETLADGIELRTDDRMSRSYREAVFPRLAGRAIRDVRADVMEAGG